MAPILSSSLRAALLLSKTILAITEVSFPINAQSPPLAQVGHPFKFEFAPTTFISSVDPLSSITYNLQGAPSWLSLTSNTRTFSGTPSSADVGPVNFGIVAADDDGSTTLPVTFVVVFNLPLLSADVFQQLSRFGPMSGPNSLSLYPGSSFQLAFASSTFVQSGAVLSYDATSANRSPLPSWITFDNTSLTFSGAAPTLISSPQTFGIRLIASSVPGFAGASFTFNLVISNHELVFEPLEHVIRVKTDVPIPNTSLIHELILDGSPIQSSELDTASAIGPNWVQFEAETLSISGKPPPGTTSADMIVTAKDIYDDQAKVVIHFLLNSQLFKGDIGVLNATIGKPFTYNIGQTLYTTDDVDISVDLGEAASWLRFNEETLTLHGNVPLDTKPGIIRAVIKASSTTRTVSQSQQFKIRIYPAGAKIVPNMPPSETRSVSTRTTENGGAAIETAVTTQSKDIGEVSVLKKVEIAMAVLIPILFIAIVVLLLCCWRKRQNSDRGSSSNPIRQHWRRAFFKNPKNPSEQDGEDLEKGGEALEAGRKTQMNRRRGENGESTSVNSWNYAQDSLDDDDDLSHASQEMERSNMPPPAIHGADMAGQQATAGTDENAIELSGKEHVSRGPTYRSSRVSQRSTGLPVNRRLSGLGHGRTTQGYPSRAYGRLNHQERVDRRSDVSNYSQTSRDRAESLQKISRTSKRISHLEPIFAETPTIRSVKEQGDENRSWYPIDGRSFEAKRRSYLNRRRSSGIAKNPLFASGGEGSRESSYSKRSPFITRSYNSQRIGRHHQRLNLTRSKSSSLGVGVSSDMYPRVIREQTQSTIRSSELWETASSSHYSENIDKDDEEGGVEVQVSEAERQSRRARLAERLARDSYEQIIELDEGQEMSRRGMLSQTSRTRSLPAQLDPLSTMFPDGSEVPAALQVRGRRVGSIGTNLSTGSHEGMTTTVFL